MSTPAFDRDDPRLTAYALGESSPAEREEVERMLASSPEVREEVEQTAAFIRALEEDYRRENETYWGERRNEPLPGKMVQFPIARRGGWKPLAASGWKIAAVIAALGVLIPLTIRQQSAQPTGTVASSQPTTTALAPIPVEATPAASDLASANVSKDADQAQSPAALPAGAGASPASENVDSLLAMNTDRARRGDEAVAPSFSRSAETRQAARPTASRAEAAPAPVVAAPGAMADAASGGGISPEDRIGRAMVQIHAKDGSYVGGVAVSADGWILAAEPLSLDATPTVNSGDRHEVSASVLRDGSGSGWCWLRITGMPLPGVALASITPTNTDTLTVVSTDRHTGTIHYLRAQVVVTGAEARIHWDDQMPTVNETTLVFNSTGELLAATPETSNAKAEHRKELSSDHTTRVRPFTTAERALLQPTSKKSSR